MIHTSYDEYPDGHTTLQQQIQFYSTKLNIYIYLQTVKCCLTNRPWPNLFVLKAYGSKSPIQRLQPDSI